MGVGVSLGLGFEIDVGTAVDIADEITFVIYDVPEVRYYNVFTVVLML